MADFKPKGIRIVGDGSVMGTSVYDSTGRNITAELGIQSLTIKHKAGEFPEVQLECNILCPEIDFSFPK